MGRWVSRSVVLIKPDKMCSIVEHASGTFVKKRVLLLELKFLFSLDEAVVMWKLPIQIIGKFYEIL